MIIKEWDNWGGKKIQLIVDAKTAAYRFQFYPGGELPLELLGLFTQERFADSAVQQYLERTKPKDKK
jgi:hypothetical protein